MRLLILSLVLGLPLLAGGSANTGGGGGGIVVPGIVSLALSDEVVPAGGVAQIKLLMTEPRPIVMGGGGMVFDTFDMDVLGIAVHSTAGDAVGTAVYQRGRLAINMVSPSGTLGSVAGYPILTIAVRIKPGTPVGTRIPFNLILPASGWQDILGSVQAVETKGGSVTVGGSLSIDNVLPGGGLILPGQTIRILGKGFQQGMSTRIDGFSQKSMQMLSTNEIDAVSATPFTLDAVRMVFKLKSGEQQTYYSYQRPSDVKRLGESITEKAVPMINAKAPKEAAILFGNGAGNKAVALQNPFPTDTTVNLQMVTLFGSIVGNATVVVPAGSRMTRTLDTLFVPFTGSSLWAVRVVSATGIESMGLIGDELAGTVQPVPARIVTPGVF